MPEQERRTEPNGAASSSQEPDHPGVIAPPPLIFLGFFLVGALLEWVRPTPSLPPVPRYVFAAAAFLVTVGLIRAAHRRFHAAGTNVVPYKPATALVSEGIYARTRNPMYLALTVAHVGLAVLFGLLWSLAAVVPAVVVIHYGVIRREERYLERKFGEPYRRYRETVRRWI